MSKPDMLKEGIDSPNLADAVMMLMRPVEVKKPTYNYSKREHSAAGWMG
jgi:hypothetical protein